MKKTLTQQFHYKTNRLQQLRGFCFAAQFGNISKAAAHMGLTHASVSLQIKALEEDMGVQLFTRRGPRIELTGEGRKLLAMAGQYVDGIDHLQELFHRELASQKRTELHIAANSTTLNFILPEVLKRYLVEHPHIYVTIHYAEHEEAIEKLYRGEVDVAMLPKRDHKPFTSGYEFTPTHHFSPALITRHDHPLAGRRNLSVAEISRYELTLPAEDMRVIPNLYEIFPTHNIAKKLRVNFVNWETTRKYIEAGLVISISSDVIIGRDDVLRATKLPHLFPQATYGFVTRRRKQVPPKVQQLIDIACETKLR